MHTKKLPQSKYAILLVISSFAVALISSTSCTIAVFAVKPDSGWTNSRSCTYTGESNYIRCCWDTAPVGGVAYCQDCKLAGTPEDPNKYECKEKELQHQESIQPPPPTPPPPPSTSGPTAAPLQDGVLQQPQQSPPLPNVKGNTNTQNNDNGVSRQQLDQGTSSNGEDNNKPLDHHKSKDNDPLGGANKDNSPTPPPCPTDNSPIPPNCTLKPKF